MEIFNWQAIQAVPSRRYTCGYCGTPLASERGWFAVSPRASNIQASIYVCHQCTRPTFIDGSENNKQTPGVVFGNPVKDIAEKSVEMLYEEARKCTGAGSYTAAILCCRKLLMHIAVSKGAKSGDTFISYVEYLADQHYVPPGAKDWVDHIRKKGNEATHEIIIMAKDDAEELLSFVEMLLKVIYEFPAAVQKKTGASHPKP